MENKMIPQLRFPEFKGEWDVKTLDQLTTRIGDGIHSTPKYNDNGNYYFINGNNLVNGEIKFFDTTKKVEEAEAKRYNKELSDRSILLSINGTIGNLAFYNNEKVMLGKSAAYINIINEVNKVFIYNVLKTSKTQNFFFSELTGSTIKNLSLKTIRETKISIPTPPEQTKIANFLTAVDKRITLLQKKKAELEQYKKGVMQKLFSQEIRFKQDDGSDFPDWEEKKLGEIGTFKTSGVDKLSKENEKEVYLVNYMNVYRHENINNSTRHNLQVVTAKDKQIESSNLNKGDILFTPSSETPTDIGHSVVIFEDLENTLFSYHLMRFRPKIKLDLLYSHYFCNIPYVLKQLSSYATGSTRFTISVGNFSKVKVLLPSFEEQQKIANFLSSIDKSIENIGNQIEESQQWKKGLLQKMFV